MPGKTVDKVKFRTLGQRYLDWKQTLKRVRNIRFWHLLPSFPPSNRTHVDAEVAGNLPLCAAFPRRRKVFQRQGLGLPAKDISHTLE